MFHFHNILAAPSIAAAAIAIGGSAATVAVTTLTSTAAVTIFGVGGGGLAAWKTHRRTKGVTEFEVRYLTSCILQFSSASYVVRLLMSLLVYKSQRCAEHSVAD